MFKKVVLINLIGICFMVCISCTTGVHASVAVKIPATSPKDSSTQPVSIVEIQAKVIVNAVGNVMLEENWNSRSKKSYEVVGDITTMLQSFNGKIIVADVIFLEKRTWSGSLVIVRFEVIDKNNSKAK